MRIVTLRTIACALVCVATVFPGIPALAQQAQSPVNEAPLTSLYQSLSRYPGDAYLQRRITEERARIRSLFEKEIQAAIEAASVTTTNGDGADLPKALDRQRKLTSSVEEQLREQKVDLDLLSEEEKKVYLNPPTGTGAMEEYRLTQTYPELLAKKAVREEHIAAIEAALPLQEERLQKLTKQYRWEQFAVFVGIGVNIGILLLIVLIEKTVRKFLLGKITQHTKRYLVTKLFTLMVYSVTILWVLSKLFSEHPGIIASFAIVGAGLAVALQDVVKDFVGWLIIIQKRPFSLGDRIAIGPHTGDVIDIGLLRTTLLEVGIATPFDALERTGKVLFVPNAAVLTQQLLNYNTTSDFTKAELQVTVTYESNWKKAEAILHDVLLEETNTFTEREFQQYEKRTWLFYVSPEPRVPQVYTDLAADGVLFTLRFTVPIGKRRDVTSKIAHKILDRFREAGIELAYRTSRVFSANPPESGGKDSSITAG